MYGRKSGTTDPAGDPGAPGSGGILKLPGTSRQSAAANQTLQPPRHWTGIGSHPEAERCAAMSPQASGSLKGAVQGGPNLGSPRGFERWVKRDSHPPPKRPSVSQSWISSTSPLSWDLRPAQPRPHPGMTPAREMGSSCT
ncbi:unnamed protein product [Gadus morhua 'NCC']